MIDSIVIEQVKHCYDNEVKLNANLSFNAPKTLLEGKNGIGKSTLLRLIAGLEQPSSGTIHFRSSHSPTVAIASDSVAIPDVFTPSEVIALLCKHKTLDLDKLNRGIDDVQFRDYCHIAYGNLSTGNKKKIQLLLAFCTNHDLLLLDEPFNGLDSDSTDYFWTQILGHNKMMIVVDHAMADSKRAIFESAFLE